MMEALETNGKEGSSTFFSSQGHKDARGGRARHRSKALWSTAALCLVHTCWMRMWILELSPPSSSASAKASISRTRGKGVVKAGTRRKGQRVRDGRILCSRAVVSVFGASGQPHLPTNPKQGQLLLLPPRQQTLPCVIRWNQYAPLLSKLSIFTSFFAAMVAERFFLRTGAVCFFLCERKHGKWVG